MNKCFCDPGESLSAKTLHLSGCGVDRLWGKKVHSPLRSEPLDLEKSPLGLQPSAFATSLKLPWSGKDSVFKTTHSLLRLQTLRHESSVLAPRTERGHTKIIRRARGVEPFEKKAQSGSETAGSKIRQSDQGATYWEA